MKKQNKVVHLTDASLPEKIKLTKKQMKAFEHITKLRDKISVIKQQIDNEDKAVWESIAVKCPFVEHSPWFFDAKKDATHIYRATDNYCRDLGDRFLEVLKGLKTSDFLEDK